MDTFFSKVFGVTSPNVGLKNSTTTYKKPEIQASKLTELNQIETSFIPKLSEVNNSRNNLLSKDQKCSALKPTKQEKKNSENKLKDERKKLKEEKLAKKIIKNCQKSTILINKQKACDEIASKCLINILHDYHEILSTGTKKIKLSTDLYRALNLAQVNKVFLPNVELNQSEPTEPKMKSIETNQIQVKRAGYYTIFEDYIILRFYFHKYANWASHFCSLFGFKRTKDAISSRRARLMLLLESERDHLALFFENDPQKAINYKIKFSIDCVRIDSFQPYLSGDKYDFQILAKTYQFLKTPWKQMMKELPTNFEVSSALFLKQTRIENDFMISNSENFKVSNQAIKNHFFADENFKNAQVELLFEIVEMLSKQFGEGCVILVEQVIEASHKSLSIGNLIALIKKMK